MAEEPELLALRVRVAAVIREDGVRDARQVRRPAPGSSGVVMVFQGSHTLSCVSE